MLLVYTALSLVLQLIFWLVPNIISSAVVFSIMGFFLGPCFAAVSIFGTLEATNIKSIYLGRIGCFKTTSETYSICRVR